MNEEKVSALEQTLAVHARRYALNGQEDPPAREFHVGMAHATEKAAKLLHARDAPLWRLADKAEADAERVLADEGDTYYTRGEIKALRAFAEDLRAILEGKTNE